jgi:hypothetical protein
MAGRGGKEGVAVGVNDGALGPSDSGRRIIGKPLMSPAWLFLSIIPGGIGFGLLIYGKKQGRWPQMAAGVLLLVYPYFATTVWSLVGAGAAIGFGLWYAIRSGL